MNRVFWDFVFVLLKAFSWPRGGDVKFEISQWDSVWREKGRYREVAWEGFVEHFCAGISAQLYSRGWDGGADGRRRGGEGVGEDFAHGSKRLRSLALTFNVSS